MADLTPRPGKHHRAVRVLLNVLADGPGEGMTAAELTARTCYTQGTVLNALSEARRAGLLQSERVRNPGRSAGFGPPVWKVARR